MLKELNSQNGVRPMRTFRLHPMVRNLNWLDKYLLANGMVMRKNGFK